MAIGHTINDTGFLHFESTLEPNSSAFRGTFHDIYAHPGHHTDKTLPGIGMFDAEPNSTRQMACN